MKYKAIIFDLDGVIVSTDKYHYEAWKSIADEMGIHFDEQINDRLRGVSRMESLEIILENFEGEISDIEKQMLAERKNEIYRKFLSNLKHSDLSNDVADTLSKLRQKGLLLAIGSSSKNARFILERIGLGDFFDAISDGNNITRSKPDPEVFLKAAGFLGIEPCDCLVVEDAEAGIEAAKAAGMGSVFMGNIDTISTDNKIGAFSELIDIIS